MAFQAQIPEVEGFRSIKHSKDKTSLVEVYQKIGSDEQYYFEFPFALDSAANKNATSAKDEALLANYILKLFNGRITAPEYLVKSAEFELDGKKTKVCGVGTKITDNEESHKVVLFLVKALLSINPECAQNLTFDIAQKIVDIPDKTILDMGDDKALANKVIKLKHFIAKEHDLFPRYLTTTTINDRINFLALKYLAFPLDSKPRTVAEVVAPKSSHRKIHGVRHGVLAALLIDIFEDFYNEFSPKKKPTIINPVLKEALKNAALLHDSGRICDYGKDDDTTETQSGETCKKSMLQCGFDADQAELMKHVIRYKDHPDKLKSFVSSNPKKFDATEAESCRALLHDADCLEIYRVVGDEFKKEELIIWQKVKAWQEAAKKGLAELQEEEKTAKLADEQIESKRELTEDLAKAQLAEKDLDRLISAYQQFTLQHSKYGAHSITPHEDIRQCLSKFVDESKDVKEKAIFAKYLNNSFIVVKVFPLSDGNKKNLNVGTYSGEHTDAVTVKSIEVSSSAIPYAYVLDPNSVPKQSDKAHYPINSDRFTITLRPMLVAKGISVYSYYTYRRFGHIAPLPLVPLSETTDIPKNALDITAFRDEDRKDGGFISATTDIVTAKSYIRLGKGYVYLIITPPGAIKEKPNTPVAKGKFEVNIPGGNDQEDIIAYRHCSDKKFDGPILIRQTTIEKYGLAFINQCCRLLIEKEEGFYLLGSVLCEANSDEINAFIQRQKAVINGIQNITFEEICANKELCSTLAAFYVNSEKLVKAVAQCGNDLLRVNICLAIAVMRKDYFYALLNTTNVAERYAFLKNEVGFKNLGSFIKTVDDLVNVLNLLPQNTWQDFLNDQFILSLIQEFDLDVFLKIFLEKFLTNECITFEAFLKRFGLNFVKATVKKCASLKVLFSKFAIPVAEQFPFIETEAGIEIVCNILLNEGSVEELWKIVPLESQLQYLDKLPVKIVVEYFLRESWYTLKSFFNVPCLETCRIAQFIRANDIFIGAIDRCETASEKLQKSTSSFLSSLKCFSDARKYAIGFIEMVELFSYIDSNLREIRLLNVECRGLIDKKLKEIKDYYQSCIDNPKLVLTMNETIKSHEVLALLFESLDKDCQTEGFVSMTKFLFRTIDIDKRPIFVDKGGSAFFAKICSYIVKTDKQPCVTLFELYSSVVVFFRVTDRHSFIKEAFLCMNNEDMEDGWLYNTANFNSDYGSWFWQDFIEHLDDSDRRIIDEQHLFLIVLQILDYSHATIRNRYIEKILFLDEAASCRSKIISKLIANAEKNADMLNAFKDVARFLIPKLQQKGDDTSKLLCEQFLQKHDHDAEEKSKSHLFSSSAVSLFSETSSSSMSTTNKSNSNEVVPVSGKKSTN
jgi:hypothetical protein